MEGSIVACCKVISAHLPKGSEGQDKTSLEMRLRIRLGAPVMQVCWPVHHAMLVFCANFECCVSEVPNNFASCLQFFPQFKIQLCTFFSGKSCLSGMVGDTRIQSLLWKMG
jgi:hypothetical protein